MMKKLFRRWTPSPERLQNHPRLKFFLARATHPRMWHLTRRGVAQGAAIGAAICVIPLPIQVLLAGFVAFTLKANVPTAVAATFLSNPLTALLIWGGAWKIGLMILGQAPANMTWPDFSFSNLDREYFEAVFNWLITNGQPLLVGMPVAALILSSGCYLLVMLGWRIMVCRQWRLRRA
jgi:uncharacterized protein (DUF2062 family)